ncbi:MAG: imidazole glycerol phosphate synthase subunit HisH [Akkermansiaceae bacterium]|nr:imidazole glycerol phosphate synthase subunit HisH [Akkermansiaceae bacterium]MDP4780573.1 imidazole glycerol phosphate synthase subunit HisH [Akkermansiaceae bacterium]MDP4847419.1 imidazole glycerol phosphate synthase subunit HisH [Akkermansiaceae bacterium]MDP4897735.1 imidazole glycerol phosphate synthase subunit HisH [Akkermansiaceae bacterium]
MRVGLVNYGGGNLRSVENALHALGVFPELITDASELGDCTHLILPGQGEFGDVMRQLDKRGLVEPLREWIAAGKPYFGICVGFQILFEGSDEAPGVEGLGIVKGRCVRFQEEEGKKIPQMGWNGTVPQDGASAYWKGLGEEPYFYFVHSYFPKPEDDGWKTTVTDYAGEKFVAAVEKGDVLACQFHPEKSQDAGLALISNFLGL